MRPYVIHGQLQDVIDYTALIKAQSLENNRSLRVKQSRRSSYYSKLSGNKSNVKRLNIKMLKK